MLIRGNNVKQHFFYLLDESSTCLQNVMDLQLHFLNFSYFKKCNSYYFWECKNSTVIPYLALTPLPWFHPRQDPFLFVCRRFRSFATVQSFPSSYGGRLFLQQGRSSKHNSTCVVAAATVDPLSKPSHSPYMNIPIYKRKISITQHKNLLTIADSPLHSLQKLLGVITIVDIFCTHWHGTHQGNTGTATWPPLFEYFPKHKHMQRIPNLIVTSKLKALHQSLPSPAIYKHR